jgi:hypothetical protein
MEAVMAQSRSLRLSVWGLLLAALTSSPASAQAVFYNRASGQGFIPNSSSCYSSLEVPTSCSWFGAYDYQPLKLHQIVSGFATADTVTGVLEASANSYDSGIPPTGSGLSRASIANTRDYHVPGGVSVASQELNMAGGLSSSAGDKLSSARGFMEFGVSDATSGKPIFDALFCSASYPFLGCNKVIGSNDGSWSASVAPWDISSTIDLTKHHNLILSFAVGADVFGNASADVTDPITIKVTPGVTWTDAAPGFLTGSPSPVPEPGSWALLMVGVLGVGYAGRMHGRKASIRQCSLPMRSCARMGLIDLAFVVGMSRRRNAR